MSITRRERTDRGSLCDWQLATVRVLALRMDDVVNQLPDMAWSFARDQLPQSTLGAAGDSGHASSTRQYPTFRRTLGTYLPLSDLVRRSGLTSYFDRQSRIDTERPSARIARWAVLYLFHQQRLRPETEQTLLRRPSLWCVGNGISVG